MGMKKAMKKQLVSIGIVALLICIGLTGCVSFESYSDDTTNTNKFIGTWTGNYLPHNGDSIISISIDAEPINYTFFSNDTYMSTKHIPHT